ncbi:MAG: hypothetical protein LBD01_00625 [Puniceicoccales bacterium]|jgi:ribonuclease D|nr:hypothetical protein [Puniceicoccales bacterium]
MISREHGAEDSARDKSAAWGKNASRENWVRIEKEAIASLPLGQFKGKVVVVESAADARAAVQRLGSEEMLGFDTESRPSFTRGVSYLPSLVQLAAEDVVYLFRLALCGGVSALFPIFCNERILKVGVAVRDDVRGLQERAPFDDAGFVEISEYTRKAGVENTGLRALVAHYLGLRVSKGAQVTNWASNRLTPQQITYAATDAWMSRCLYERIKTLGLVRA